MVFDRPVVQDIFEPFSFTLLNENQVDFRGVPRRANRFGTWSLWNDETEVVESLSIGLEQVNVPLQITDFDVDTLDDHSRQFLTPPSDDHASRPTFDFWETCVRYGELSYMDHDIVWDLSFVLPSESCVGPGLLVWTFTRPMRVVQTFRDRYDFGTTRNVQTLRPLMRAISSGLVVFAEDVVQF